MVPAVPVGGAGGTQPGKVVDRPRQPDLPIPSTEKAYQLPTEPSKSPAPAPGEATVLNLNRNIAAAVIGGVLFAPAHVNAKPPLTVPNPVVPSLPTAADDKTEISELKKQLEASDKKLSDIQETLRLLNETLNGKRDKDGNPFPIPGLVGQVKELKDKLKLLEDEVTKLKTNTSLRPTTPTNPPNPMTPTSPVVDPKAGKGTVRVVNEYPVQISIVVNGTSYRVAPTKSLDIDVAAGEFTYQLLESGAAATRSVIKEKETVTLRIK
jgi:hypothetical protein